MQGPPRGGPLTTMIEITDVAAKKIQSLMAKQGISEGGLRVGVKGGGCSGLSYTFAWEKQARLGDEVLRAMAPRSSWTRRVCCS